MLSDQDIKAALAGGQIVISPEPADRSIQPASIDLHLGPTFARWAVKGATLRLADGTAPELMELVQGPTFALAPGEHALAATLERVKLGAGYAARVEGRSTFGRLGLAIHVTAGFVDPGWPGWLFFPMADEGQITLEFVNFSPNTLVLDVGMPICQLAIERLSSPAERPYGSAGIGSKYAGRAGVQRPRLEGIVPR